MTHIAGVCSQKQLATLRGSPPEWKSIGASNVEHALPYCVYTLARVTSWWWSLHHSWLIPTQLLLHLFWTEVSTVLDLSNFVQIQGFGSKRPSFGPWHLLNAVEEKKTQQFACSPTSPYAPSKLFLLFFLKRVWEQERVAVVGRAGFKEMSYI